MYETPTIQEVQESDWQPLAEQETFALTKFLSNHLQKPIENQQRYDSLTELHFSGLNDIFDKIVNGTATVISAKKFFSGGAITQIHIIFDSEGPGHNTDVYLQGKALKDFLEFNSK